MTEIKRACTCYDCEQKRINEERHLNHPFYKKVDEVTDQVKVEQILKGANKYKEPFNPDSWTNKELVWHQLQELRDAQVYSVGLLDRLEKQDAAYKNLLKDYEAAKQEAEYWRLRAKTAIVIPEIKTKPEDAKKLFDEIKKALGENFDAQG
jgi:hypothetical protein